MKKVVFLGMDGLDPKVIQTLIGRDRLPHMKALSARGCFSEIQSTNPPQSPVAWASAATGLNPGHHGIYDFIARDPELIVRHCRW